MGPRGEDGTDSPLGDIDAPRPLVADLFSRASFGAGGAPCGLAVGQVP